MAFTLVTASGERIDYGDRASYAFNGAGFLVVIADDGMRLTFSHTSWHHVEDLPKSGW